MSASVWLMIDCYHVKQCISVLFLSFWTLSRNVSDNKLPNHSLTQAKNEQILACFLTQYSLCRLISGFNQTKVEYFACISFWGHIWPFLDWALVHLADFYGTEKFNKIGRLSYRPHGKSKEWRLMFWCFFYSSHCCRQSYCLCSKNCCFKYKFCFKMQGARKKKSSGLQPKGRTNSSLQEPWR